MATTIILNNLVHFGKWDPQYWERFVDYNGYDKSLLSWYSHYNDTVRPAAKPRDLQYLDSWCPQAVTPKCSAVINGITMGQRDSFCDRNLKMKLTANQIAGHACHCSMLAIILS